MSGEAIAAMAAVGPSLAVADPVAAGGGIQAPAFSTNTVGATAPGGFGEMFTSGLQDVNSGLMANETSLQALAVDALVNMHEVMIRLEESRLKFQLLMQVRGRLLDAYQDVMRMQV